MRWGGKIKFLRDMYEDTGVIPAALANRPVLDGVFTWPHSVWKELSNSRNYVEGVPAAIAFSEVAIYALVHGCTKLETASLWEDLHRIDNAWRAEVAKNREDQAS